ncbi:MAG: calcium/sodium antiporter [Pseudomonadota bacterium]
MIITLTTFLCGLLLLVAGAEGLVRGASALALRLGVSPLLIGLTVVAFGTSAPELAVSVEAALNDNSSIALGNIVGSNIANIALILGLAALIQPMRVQSSLLTQQIPIMIGVSALLWVLLLDQTLGFWDGVLLLGGIIVYVIFSYRHAGVVGLEVNLPIEAAPLPAGGTALLSNMGFCLLIITLGLIALVSGGSLLVDSAVEIAQRFNVSETLVGLTIVAVGTSLPELATSLVAAVRKQDDIAIGNIVGSNIFNILGILGLASILHPISSAGFAQTDFVVMLLLAVLLLPLAWTGRRLGRMEGLVLLAAYVAYVYYLLLKT